MKTITIKEASRMMQKPEQWVRVAIYAGKIPGAFYLPGKNNKRGTYFITDEQITNLMKGARHEES